MLDIQGIIAIIGAIAFFAGLFGGFKAKDLEISALPKQLRFFAFFVGVIFIGLAIWPFVRKEILTDSSATVMPTATNISQLAENPPTITTPTATNTRASTTSVPPTPTPQTKACTPMALNKAEIIPTGMWVLIRICTPRSGNASACTYTIEQSQGGTYTPNEHSGNSPRTGIWTYCTEDEAKKAANTEASDPSFVQWWPATQIPFPELITTAEPQIASPTPTLPPPQTIWRTGGILAQTGYTSIGNPEAWVVFQVWDGTSPSSVVHGVIEPSWSLQISAPIEGTMWTVTNISRDQLISRVIEMRKEVVDRDHISEPPLLYIGTDSAPQGFTSQLPNGWNAQH